MTSFADFLINLINYFGIGLIFLFIFYFAVFYGSLIFLFNLMKKDQKQGEQKGKDVYNIVALLISVSAAFFLSTLSGYFLFTQYFLSFIAATLVIFLFFILIVNILTNGKFFESLSSNISQQSNPPSRARYIPLVIIVFLIVFALLSMYYAYQSYFVSIISGTNPQAQIYQITFNPYVIFAFMLFILIGVFLILSQPGAEQGGQQKGQGGEGKK